MPENIEIKTKLKVKDSYTKKEVEEVCKAAFKAGEKFRMKGLSTDLMDEDCPDIDTWLQNNL